MESNYVLLGRHAYPDSLLMAVFETHLRFGIGLTHGFRPTRRRATVTRARGHEVLELDGRPATEAYARLLGTSPEALAGKHLTLTTRQPVGSCDYCGRYNINVASFITPRGGVRFSQPVPEGSLLTIMEADQDNMISAGKEGLRKALVRGGVTDPAVAFVFSCALRCHILGERTEEEISSIREILAGVPAMGFYSFGEQGLADDGVNRHNNSVISVLVLSRELSYAAQVSLENDRLRKELEQEVVKYKQAEEALKRAHEDLECRVAERSAESSKANEQLKHEITGRRDAEHTLRIRDWAIDSSINGIAFADLQGSVTYANDSCLKMWGYNSEKEVLGKSVIEFWQDQKPSAKIGYLLNDNRSWIGELVARKKDGSPFDVQLSACLVMDEKGRPTCMMGSFVDISESKRIERDLAQQNRYNKLRADIWKLASDKSLEEDELIQRLLEKIGPVIGVSRACFNTLIESKLN